MQFTTRNGYHWRQYILEMCDYTSEVVKKRNYYLHTNITVGIKIIIKKKMEELWSISKLFGIYFDN